jgi:4-hydroxy-3-methylbut-2-en-1-yl diphosphate reductase
MTLTVAAALRLEARAVRRGLTASPVVVTGMGPRRAQLYAPRLGGRGPLAVVGLCGALRPGLAAGTAVVATEVRAADGSVAKLVLPSAPALANELRREGFNVVEAALVSSTRIVRGPGRAGLGETGAVAADMESAWLLDALVRRRVDPRGLAAVRVVLDTPEHELWSAATAGSLRVATRILRRLGPVLERWAEALGERRVVLAAPRSFCAGVERAIDIVERALERYGRPVYVRRQIVHNTHVVRRLEAAGAIFVEELDDVPDGATVIFAAHGVTPEVRREAETRGLFVVDATCPLVAKVHHEARRHRAQGTRIVLIGHADHEEVVGTLGEAPEALVVSGPDDVGRLDIAADERVAYLTQTTLATDETEQVLAALRARFPDIAAPASDDICYATQNRQEAVKAIAGESELLLVVGSPNSSNSNRLAEVARRAGVPAQLIEDETELELGWLHGVRTIGLTAGASAPDTLVEHVLGTLAALGPITVDEHVVVEEAVQFRLPQEVR